MAIAKKATKTTPTPHWHWITLDWGCQHEPDLTWFNRHHVTAKKHPVVANQLLQRSLAPEVTWGCQELSLQLACKHLASELEYLARVVIARNRAANAIGLGTPTLLGMIWWQHTHHHLSMYLDDQLLNHQPWLVQRHVWEHLRFRVVQAELVRYGKRDWSAQETWFAIHKRRGMVKDPMHHTPYYYFITAICSTKGAHVNFTNLVSCCEF